jgi:hypothetical protein
MTVTNAAASLSRRDQAAVGLRITVVTAALLSAVIHLGLGSLLFLANAAGFTVLAIALIVPGKLADRFRWLPRFGMLGFAGATLVGWFLFGPRYLEAYITVVAEVVIVGAVAADIVLAYGSPFRIVRRVQAAIGA